MATRLHGRCHSCYQTDILNQTLSDLLAFRPANPTCTHRVKLAYPSHHKSQHEATQQTNPSDEPARPRSPATLALDTPLLNPPPLPCSTPADPTVTHPLNTSPRLPYCSRIPLYSTRHSPQPAPRCGGQGRVVDPRDVTADAERESEGGGTSYFRWLGSLSVGWFEGGKLNGRDIRLL